MFCSHKYGEVKDGYQYCKKCGKAIKAPVIKCNHKWSIKDSGTVVLYGSNSGDWYTQVCNTCGELKYFDTTKQR